MLYIVDDDLDFSNLLKDISSAFYDSVTVYNDSAAFFEEAPLSDDDVIILDIKMPKMDGVEILRGLANKDCKSTLILVSGYEGSVLNSTSMLANESGLNLAAQLMKPFEPQKLIGVLEKLLSKSDPVKFLKSSPSEQARPNVFSKEVILEAIEQDQFCLYYQPQFELKTMTLVSVEGLIRWNHPTKGVLTPFHFLTDVKLYDLLGLMTDKVMQYAINAESNWSKIGFEISTSININAKNVTNLSLPEKLEKLLEDEQVDPSKICLEVTESELMTELIPSMDTLTRMRLKGFKLSIDDFGTGFSSLLQLYRIPFTELKIDRSFVINLTESEESKIIVEMCILMAHKLGMKVVAEGIEDKETYAILKEMGCDLGQGYYFAKPLPEQELLLWLHESKKRTPI